MTFVLQLHCFVESCKTSTKPLFIHFFDEVFTFPGYFYEIMSTDKSTPLPLLLPAPQDPSSNNLDVPLGQESDDLELEVLNTSPLRFDPIGDTTIQSSSSSKDDSDEVSGGVDRQRGNDDGDAGGDGGGGCSSRSIHKEQHFYTSYNK